MELDELAAIIQKARWFANLGEHPAAPEFVVLRDLKPPAEPEQWDWLPTSQAEADPIHPLPLKAVALELGRGERLHDLQLRFYRDGLRSLRSAADHPLLKVGPHDYTNAARGGALFAIRVAVSEIVVEQVGFWCALMPLYSQGHWPLGLHDDGRVVIL